MILRRENILKEFCCLLTILALTLVSSECFGVEILNFRHWAAPDHTRIVLDVDGVPIYTVKENENLLTLTLKESSLNKTIPQSSVIHKPGIRKIIFHRTKDNNVKIDFILDRHQNTEVFKLKKFQDKPDRIVLDIFLEEVHKELKSKKEIATAKKKKIIIIDPGHGGEDPGAIGKKKTYEKNVVLSISRELQKSINRTPGYSAFLTRDGDYYVSFKKRLQKAKDLNASLFISVHADAARNRSARGSSVYCLSTGGASNEAAKLLARNENLADILGGVPDSEGNNESNQIIMNMFQTNTINLSKIFAGTLIKHLGEINCLKYQTVQEAPLRVLKLPDIPAVLIETAYISNPQEEVMLKRSSFQKTLAVVIASSVREYLGGTDKIPQKESKTVATSYKIKKGDTLFSVARHFNTKPDDLLKLNNLKLDDRIFVGQKIKIPASQEQDIKDNDTPSEKTGE